MNTEMFVEKVKVVELTLEDGSKMLCRGGEQAVFHAWDKWPVVSARWTGEEETSPITAVVVRDEDCQRRVHTIAPPNIQ